MQFSFTELLCLLRELNRGGISLQWKYLCHGLERSLSPSSLLWARLEESECIFGASHITQHEASPSSQSAASVCSVWVFHLPFSCWSCSVYWLYTERWHVDALLMAAHPAMLADGTRFQMNSQTMVSVRSGRSYLLNFVFICSSLWFQSVIDNRQKGRGIMTDSWDLLMINSWTW